MPLSVMTTYVICSVECGGMQEVPVSI